MLVNLGPGGANAQYSTDGVNFTSYRIGQLTQGNYGIAYGNGVWVASVGEEEIWYSTEYNPILSEHWTKATYPNLGSGYYQVRYDGIGTFLVVGSSGKLLTSNDGINWTKQTAPSTDTFYKYLTYGGGKFVTISANNKDGAWSNTGTTVGTSTLTLTDDTNLANFRVGDEVQVKTAVGKLVTYVPGSPDYLYDDTPGSGFIRSSPNLAGTFTDTFVINGPGVLILNMYAQGDDIPITLTTNNCTCSEPNNFTLPGGGTLRPVFTFTRAGSFTVTASKLRVGWICDVLLRLWYWE